ncbi:hypothetical protein [Halovulum sp. GXIMD14793]
MADSTAYKIPPTPSLEDAQAFAATLKDGPADQPVHLDASALEVMTTPFALAVLSAMESRTSLTPPAIVSGATDEFVAAFTDLGLFQEMMKMEFAT